MDFLCGFGKLRQRRLQFLHARQLRAGELAAQTPRSEVEQELLAGALVERLAGGARVELGAKRRSASSSSPPSTSRARKRRCSSESK